MVADTVAVLCAAVVVIALVLDNTAKVVAEVTVAKDAANVEEAVSEVLTPALPTDEVEVLEPGGVLPVVSNAEARELATLVAELETVVTVVTPAATSDGLVPLDVVVVTTAEL